MNKLLDIDDAYGAIKLDGFDNCIMGIAEEFGNGPRIIYSKEKIIEKLKDPSIRERWIIEQRTELLNTLNTKMDPMFYYREYCEPKEQIVNSIRTSPLF